MKRLPLGLYYNPTFVSSEDNQECLEWLKSIFPIWENRYSANHPPPKGREQRRLLRPVYWLGNWQFACLDYYRPPKNIHDCCVKAEPYPAVLKRWVDYSEKVVHQTYSKRDIPKGWHLNTCLVNLYGNQKSGEKRVGCGRVGEHKDFEPGPVASVSLGERAFFQFVSSGGHGTRSQSVWQQWLDNRSLQIFGGDRWKRHLFHRVQRVEDKGRYHFELNVQDFEVRRVNFTFRYVPDEFVVPFSALSAAAADDVRPYVQELARHSQFFEKELKLRV